LEGLITVGVEKADGCAAVWLPSVDTGAVDRENRTAAHIPTVITINIDATAHFEIAERDVVGTNSGVRSGGSGNGVGGSVTVTGRVTCG